MKVVYAGTEHFGLILSDVGLPKVSGVELARTLRVRDVHPQKLQWRLQATLARYRRLQKIVLPP